MFDIIYIYISCGKSMHGHRKNNREMIQLKECQLATCHSVSDADMYSKVSITQKQDQAYFSR